MKVLLFVFVIFISSYANKTEATYDISYGIIGKLGSAYSIIEQNEDSYYIRIEASTIGIARVLSNNRQEVYESRGKVVSGLYIPSLFQKTRITNSYRKVKKYTFDHKNKIVYLESIKQEQNNNAEYNKHKFEYYAKNDILSLYFNIIQLLQISKDSNMIFHAIGGKVDDGKIDIVRPKEDELKRLQSILSSKKGETILKVIINQDIFSSENGVLLMSIDNKKNICTKAVLENVLFFGDIVGELVQ